MRSDGSPTTTPKRNVMSEVTGRAIRNGKRSAWLRNAEEYAPMAMNAAWPSEICPVNPVKSPSPHAPTA